MSKYGLWVRLEAKSGMEEQLAAFLKSAVPLVQQEPKTIAWFAIRISKNEFGIFDTFNDESGRADHLSGKVAAALMEKAPTLLKTPPSIEKIDVLADKLPG